MHITDTISSLNHPMAEEIRGHLDRQTRLSTSEILIDDLENIEQALAGGLRLKSLFVSGMPELPASFLAKLGSKVPIYDVAKSTCKKVFEADRVTRVFAIAYLPPRPPLSQFSKIQSDLLLLDGLSISGNIGAMIRTAAAFSIGAIVVLDAHPMDLYDRRVIRASRGYIFRIPVISASTEELLEFCQAHDIDILATAAQGNTPVGQISSLKKPLAIVLGAEKTGCSEKLKQAAKLQVSIPMAAMVESLNVSVAASIILYLRHNLSGASNI